LDYYNTRDLLNNVHFILQTLVVVLNDYRFFSTNSNNGDLHDTDTVHVSFIERAIDVHEVNQRQCCDITKGVSFLFRLD
jgi:hypothetical protein